MKLTRKTVLIFLLISAAAAAVFAENPAQTDEPEEKKVKVFMQVGALEKKEGDKFLLRRVSSHIEFLMTPETPVYIREQGKKSQLLAGSYLVVKGQRNTNTVIANAVYIYKNKQEYEAFNEIAIREAAETGRIFNTELKGVLLDSGDMFDRMDEHLRPLLIQSDERDDEGRVKKYLVSNDADTYWVMNRKTSQSEMAIGDRLKLLFDRSISIRIKNYPVKVIIDKVKAGF